MTKLLKKDLVRICRNKNWKGYSRLNKSQLLRFVQNRERIQKREAARIIIKFYRRWRAKQSFTQINDCDPITLEDIPTTDKFTVKIDQSTNYYSFQATLLLKYMLKEGVFKNPFDNLPFQDSDLLRLHMIVTAKSQLVYNINNFYYVCSKNTNILEVKRTVEAYRKEQREQAEVMEMLRHENTDIFSNIMASARAITCTDDVYLVFMTMNNYHINTYMDNLQNAVHINYEEAVQQYQSDYAMLEFLIQTTNSNHPRSALLHMIKDVLIHFAMQFFTDSID